MEIFEDVPRPVPVDEAWRLLLDIERIAPCMPGRAAPGDRGRRVPRHRQGQGRPDHRAVQGARAVRVDRRLDPHRGDRRIGPRHPRPGERVGDHPARARRRGRPDDRTRGDRPRHHRQGRPVRTRGDRPTCRRSCWHSSWRTSSATCSPATGSPATGSPATALRRTGRPGRPGSGAGRRRARGEPRRPIPRGRPSPRTDPAPRSTMGSAGSTPPRPRPVDLLAVSGQSVGKRLLPVGGCCSCSWCWSGSGGDGAAGAAWARRTRGAESDGVGVGPSDPGAGPAPRIEPVFDLDGSVLGIDPGLSRLRVRRGPARRGPHGRGAGVRRHPHRTVGPAAGILPYAERLIDQIRGAAHN